MWCALWEKCQIQAGKEDTAKRPQRHLLLFWNGSQTLVRNEMCEWNPLVFVRQTHPLQIPTNPPDICTVPHAMEGVQRLLLSPVPFNSSSAASATKTWILTGDTLTVSGTHLRGSGGTDFMSGLLPGQISWWKSRLSRSAALHHKAGKIRAVWFQSMRWFVFCTTPINCKYEIPAELKMQNRLGSVLKGGWHRPGFKTLNYINY